MVFYYALRAIASSLNNVRSAVFSMAVAIRNVWLIGDNLYTWFSTIAAYISLLVNLGYSASNDWLSTYNDLKNANTYIPGLSEILYYLDDILSLVRDFEYNVDKAVRQRFPNLYNLNLNPIAYIINTLTAYTGLTAAFIQNPYGFINGIITTALGDLRNFIDNPYVYLTGVLSRGNPDLYYLLINPRAWLQMEIGASFPQLTQLLADPGGYILARLADSLERTIDSFGVRLAKVAEKIINYMF
jgi:hypothetical protein